MNQSESIEYPAIWSISGTINIRPSPLYIDINNGYECNIINSPHLQTPIYLIRQTGIFKLVFANNL